MLAAVASVSDQSIVVGGGLAGMSAANTFLENGSGVFLLHKFLLDKFTSDPLKGGGKKPERAKVLCENSGADVEWLTAVVNLNLSLVARLGGHSAHRFFPAVSLRIAGAQQLCQVKRMLGKIGNVLISTYSQTLNV